MLVLTIVVTVVLAVAVVYIVALLRSHADILRRLAALENGAGSHPGPRAAVADGGGVTGAAEISGITVDGDAVMLSFGAGSPVTLLAFLTSGCAACAPLWADLGDAGRLASVADRLVVVTHGPARESPARVRELAAPGVEVVMASAAWADYAVPASPHFVLTDGAGGIRGQGSALSWSQLMGMVGDARADAQDGGAGTPASAGPEAIIEPPADADLDVAVHPSARTTAERAARSEQTLARSGIGPGHPSLYPSAVDSASEEHS
jgi:hypothetical protein